MHTLSDRSRHILSFLILSIIGLTIYSNSLSGPFIFDDHDAIERSAAAFSFRNLFDPRYLGNLTFFLNYAAGGLNPFGYHAVNTAIHILNSFFVYLIVGITLRTPAMRSMAKEGASSCLAPLAASLLFLTHPVQTQAVTYISQRYASLAAFFYLASVALYAKARLSEGSRGRWVFYAAGVLTTAAAQKTKEISFTLPFILLLYEFTFFNEGKGFKKRALYLLPFLLSLLIVPAGRFSIAGVTGNGSGVSGMVDLMLKEDLPEAPLGRHDYLLTQFRVLVTYLRLLVLPVGQNLDYDYPVYRTLLTPEVLISLTFLSGIALSALFLFIRSKRRGEPLGALVSFGAFWFFITISVESSIIPISDVIFEHRLYLPSAGVFAAFSVLVLNYPPARSGPARKAVFALLGIIVIAGSIAAFRRNAVWQSELGLWQDAAAKSPGKARPYTNLGFALVRKGRVAEAVPYFEKSIELDGRYWRAYNNMGYSLTALGRPGEAVRYLEIAVRNRPDYLEAYNNLGNALNEAGRPDESIVVLKEAIRLNPAYPSPYYNIGNALFQMGRFEEAAWYFREAIRVGPNFLDAYVNLGNTLVKLERFDEAIEEYEKALKLNPGYGLARMNLSYALRRKAVIVGSGGESGFK